jgi:hypothetical protein
MLYPPQEVKKELAARARHRVPARADRKDRRPEPTRQILPFGIAEMDSRLPGGGLARGALHEIAGGGNGTIDGAAAGLFAAGIAARTKGKVLWAITRPDLFAPALAQVDLAPDRVIYVEAGNDKTVLACIEEGLRHGGLGAVVGDIARLDMTALRRLQLCAEETGTIGIALRRWRRQTEAVDFGQPTAATTGVSDRASSARRSTNRSNIQSPTPAEWDYSLSANWKSMIRRLEVYGQRSRKGGRGECLPPGRRPGRRHSPICGDTPQRPESESADGFSVTG